MKLEMILESKKNKYLLNILEESSTELETLKSKKYLNENIQEIRKFLIEEGFLNNAKEHLKNNWGKYATGLGAGAIAGESLAHSDEAGELAKNVAGHVTNDENANKVGETVTNTLNKTNNFIKEHNPFNQENSEDHQHHITDNDESKEYVTKVLGDNPSKATLDQAIKDHKISADNAYVKQLMGSFKPTLPGVVHAENTIPFNRTLFGKNNFKV